MATANERLAEAAVDHAVDLSQYSEGVVRRLRRLLDRTDADLSAELGKALERLPAHSFTVQRLERLLKAVRELNAQAYARIEQSLTTELGTFVDVEAGYQFDLFERVVPKPVQLKFEIAAVDAEQVYAAALSRPFQGRLLRDWAAKIEGNRLELIRNTVRLGFVEGQTNEQIVRRLLGSATNRFADGAFETARREMRAVVHTAISHTAEVVRDRFYAANDDLVAGIIWQATLDTKTSEICRIRDGLQYGVNPPHRPIGHDIPWLQGPGRSHWNCRSSSRPALKSWKALGFDSDQLPPSARASMDGQVPDSLVYGDWLQRQSAFRQDEVLGATRGKLMRDGKLAFDRLYDNRGQYLTLEELRGRNAAAFERAGL